MSAKNKKTDDVKKLQSEVKQDASAEVLSSEKSETVSSKKVIYAEIDDEVTAIFDKLKVISGKHIYIVVPQRAILFQSIVNLKILKRKAEDGDKKIYLITNDPNGVHLAQKIGIPVYDKADEEGRTKLFSTETTDERLRITPLKASVNEIEENTPTRLNERKISISEVLQNKKERKILDVIKIESSEKQKAKKEKSKFVIVSPNRHALIGLISVSLIILLVIVYIALPGVTIYLTPSASVLEKSVNITLADFQKNKSELDTKSSHMIASYPVDTKFTKSIVHTATGKKLSERGKNASGKLTIINTTNNAWPLVATTRFQTNDGIVFRIPGAANVPSATANGPGKIEVYVVADQIDAYGSISGERGNIAPSKFFLPGLKESSRSLIYGESSAPMTGGITDYISFITEEDIEAAKSRLNDELIKSAVSELKMAIEKKGELSSSKATYTLLEGEKAIKIGEVEMNVPPDLKNKEISEFTVNGSISVSGVYYDRDEMLEILKNELLLKKSPQKELLRINEDSTSYRIFDWNETTGKIKVTANIKGIEQYEIDQDKESGERLTDKIKEHIAGQDIETAKQYIQNLPEINKVEIESWPAWSPTIPSIQDNIDFEVRDAAKAN